MTTIFGPSHSKSYAGLLPIEPPEEFVRPITLENGLEPPPFRKRASRALARFLITFCIGVTATLAWQSYGGAVRQMIANSYPQLGWLAPRGVSIAEKAPDTMGLATSAALYSDQQQLETTSRDLRAMRQDIERIAASQELVARGIDQIATAMADSQRQMARNTDQSAPIIAQAALARASGVTVEGPPDGASLPPTVSPDTRLAEAKPQQASSEKGKQLSAASGHDFSCFPSASAVLQHHRGGWPSWTTKAPGHEGTICWYASARPRTGDHRNEIVRRKEAVGMIENVPSAPPAPYARPPE